MLKPTGTGRILEKGNGRWGGGECEAIACKVGKKIFFGQEAMPTNNPPPWLGYPKRVEQPHPMFLEERAGSKLVNSLLGKIQLYSQPFDDHFPLLRPLNNFQYFYYGKKLSFVQGKRGEDPS